MAKTIMKLTETLAIVKISGATTENITLKTDLLPAKKVVSRTQTVGIGFINWTTGGDVTITRNGVEVYKLYQNASEFDLSGNGGMLDTTQGTSNIVVTITTGGVCFLTLRKMSGYASKIEPEKFGIYDNPAAVGS